MSSEPLCQDCGADLRSFEQHARHCLSRAASLAPVAEATDLSDAEKFRLHNESDHFTAIKMPVPSRVAPPSGAQTEWQELECPKHPSMRPADCPCADAAPLVSEDGGDTFVVPSPLPRATEPEADYRESDAALLAMWRSVNGPLSGLTGPLIRFAALVRASSAPPVVSPEPLRAALVELQSAAWSRSWKRVKAARKAVEAITGFDVPGPLVHAQEPPATHGRGEETQDGS